MYFSIETGQAATVKVNSGQHVRVINSEGHQVVDAWAFNTSDMTEYLSMSHSRSATYHLMFCPGDTLVSNRFQAILEFYSDSSDGHHDTLHAACSENSYEFFGLGKEHANCQNNCLNGLAKHGCSATAIPDPWNLFEHTNVESDLSLEDRPSSVRAGEYVELVACMNLLLICSACPSTVGGISGEVPRGAAIEILD